MITELADWTPDVDILGNVGFRRIVLTGHQKLPGHEHNFPHATAVVRGKVKVTFKEHELLLMKPLADTPGLVTEQSRTRVPERVQVYEAPAKFEVPAFVPHQIESLSPDGAECWCIFGVRDESGEIAEMVEDRHRRDKFWHERLGGGA